VYPNPFEVYGPSWENRRAFLAVMESKQAFRTNVLEPVDAAYAHRGPRRPSLPAILETKDPENYSTDLGTDCMFPMRLLEDKPKLRRKGRLSMIASPVDSVARDLAHFLEPSAKQEEGDEIQVQDKLDFWDAGHERYVLELSTKTLMQDDFYFLAHALRFNFLLQSIDLSTCFVTDLEMQMLCDSMKSNICTTSLLLRQTKVGDEGARSLLKLFKLNSTLTNIDLRQTTLTGEGGRMLAAAMDLNRNLKHINGLDLEDTSKNPPDEADFSSHFFGAAEVVLLEKLLRGADNVHTLNLRKNRLGPKASVNVVSLMQSLPSLTSTDLAFNRIGSQGFGAIAGFLGTNTTLRHLDISTNGGMLLLPKKETNDTGAQALADVLVPGKNDTLQTLNVEGNDITEDLDRWLAERMAVNRAISYGDSDFEMHLANSIPTEEGNEAAGDHDLDMECHYAFLISEQAALPFDECLKLGDQMDSYTVHPIYRQLERRRARGDKPPQPKHVPIYVEEMDVMCRWKVDGRLYPGRILKLNEDGTFNVKFKDGTMATSMPRSDLRQGHRTDDSRWDP